MPAAPRCFPLLLGQAPRPPEHSGPQRPRGARGLALCGAAALPEGRRSRRPKLQRHGLASGAGPEASRDYGSRHAALFRGQGTPGRAAPCAPGAAVPPQSPGDAGLPLPAVRTASRAGVSLQSARGCRKGCHGQDAGGDRNAVGIYSALAPATKRPGTSAQLGTGPGTAGEAAGSSGCPLAPGLFLSPRVPEQAQPGQHSLRCSPGVCRDSAAADSEPCMAGLRAPLAPRLGTGL